MYQQTDILKLYQQTERKEVLELSPKIGQKLTDNPKSKRIQVRMDKETVEKLDYLVEKNHSDRSKIIREEIENRYERETKK